MGGFGWILFLSQLNSSFKVKINGFFHTPNREIGRREKKKKKKKKKKNPNATST